MNILHSRAFWTAVLDAVISLVVLAIGLQWPAYLDLSRQIIVTIQPVLAMLIAAFTIDDTTKVWAAIKEREIAFAEAQLRARVK